MESPSLHLNPDAIYHAAPPRMVTTGSLFKYIIFLLLLSLVTLMTSCMVIPVPRHALPGMRIEQHDGGGHHDNGKHKGENRNK